MREVQKSRACGNLDTDAMDVSRRETGGLEPFLLLHTALAHFGEGDLLRAVDHSLGPKIGPKLLRTAYNWIDRAGVLSRENAKKIIPSSTAHNGYCRAFRDRCLKPLGHPSKL